MTSGQRVLLAMAVLATGLAWLAPAAAQSGGEQASPGKPAWRNVLKLGQREFDPSKVTGNALKFPNGLKTHRFDYEYVPPRDKKH